MANLLHHLPKRDVLMLRWIVVLVIAASAASLAPARADDRIITINGDSRGINSTVAVIATLRPGSTTTQSMEAASTNRHSSADPCSYAPMGAFPLVLNPAPGVNLDSHAGEAGAYYCPVILLTLSSWVVDLGVTVMA